MICPKCNSPVSFKKNRCDRCGEDITIYKKVISASNGFYNIGLDKAKVRDLSGAIIALKKSVEINKKNIQARNLLGLVYYEIGEPVQALSEWVISKHYQSQENDADGYIREVQKNPSKLESINQAIKKYNLAVTSAKQGNEDLAIIQLKKVVSLNPKFVRAYQLLALLCIKTNEKEKAVKYLYKAKKIDINNTTTLRYLREIGEVEAEVVPVIKAQTSTAVSTTDGQDSSKSGPFPTFSSFEEEKPSPMLFVNLIIGVVVGILVTWFLIVPTINKSITDKQVNDLNTYSEKISEQTAQIKTLEDNNKALNEEIDQLNKEIEALGIETYDVANYDTLFDGIQLYLEDKSLESAETLLKVDEDSLESDTAKEIYTFIKDTTFKEASKTIYEEGNTEYNAYHYDKAEELLTKALELDPENVDAVYFLGRTYHQTGDIEKAKFYYNKVIDEFPDSSKRVVEAKQRLSTIPQ